MKKLFISVLSLMMCVMMMPLTPAKAASVKINSTNFPDANFREYLKTHADTDKDGYLKDNELTGPYSISFDGNNIKTLEGLQNFPNIEYLYIYDEPITSLDVSMVPKLRTLTVYGTKFKTIKNLKTLKNLENLNVNQKQFYVLDLDNANYKNVTINDYYLLAPDKAALSLFNEDWNAKKVSAVEGVEVSGSYLKGYGDIAIAKLTYTKPNGVSINIKLGTQYLDAPTYPKAERAGYNSIKVTWYDDYNADYFQIYRSTSKSGSYSKVGTVKKDVEKFTDKSLTCGKTYYYRVRGYKTINEGKAYSKFSSVVSAKPTLKAPSNIDATQLSGSYTYKVTWSKVTGAQYYQLYRSTSANGTYKKVATTSSKTNYKKITSSSDYYYKVRAYRVVNDKKVYSSFSDKLHVWWY